MIGHPARPDDELLRRWYVEERLSLRTIAARCGVVTDTVSVWIQDAGIPRRARFEAASLGNSRHYVPGDTVLLTGTNRRAEVVAVDEDKLTLSDPSGTGCPWVEYARDWEVIDADVPPLPDPVCAS